jgi:hypothetical protein
LNRDAPPNADGLSKGRDSASARKGSMRATNGLVPSIILAGAAAALSTLLLNPHAIAQYGRTFRTTIKLTSTDLAIVRKIVREDFTGKPNGTMMSWRNPESGNSGTLTLLDRFPSSGRDCRRVKYFIQPGPKQPASVIPATYVLTSCRLADGSWKLDDQAKPDSP